MTTKKFIFYQRARAYLKYPNPQVPHNIFILTLFLTQKRFFYRPLVSSLYCVLTNPTLKQIYTHNLAVKSFQVYLYFL